MTRIQDSIEVNAPISECYRMWENFENFPNFMKNVESVQDLGNGLWHWKVHGPMGVTTEWDAEVHGKSTNEAISWQSTPDSKVRVHGAVRFEKLSEGRTRITATNEYDPPGGPVGDAIAQIFSNPEQMMKEDLKNFKEHVERGSSVRAGTHTQEASYGSPGRTETGGRPGD